jgi:phosphoglycerate dehydrogenase-like enzyme
MAVTPSDSQPGADKKFVVAWTGDFFDATGQPKYQDMGRSVLAAQAHVEDRVLTESRSPLAAEQLAGAQTIIVLAPAVTVDSVARADDLLAIARFGVGYDSVDVAACTAADVAVLIASGAVDRSVAEATVGWMIALGHHSRIKDQLLRSGQWHERTRYMGLELRDRVLGIVGLGGIARALLELLGSFGMRQPLAYDPFVERAAAARLGVRLVELDELLAEADFVSLHCPLNAATRGLIGRRELALMKPSAYLLNTARGSIVDEEALYDVLAEGRIAGAALDCFAAEPVLEPNRFAALDNVLLAPHSIAWTHELFRDIGRVICSAVVDLSLGKRPGGVVNPQVFERPGFRAKWQRLACFAAVQSARSQQDGASADGK